MDGPSLAFRKKRNHAPVRPVHEDVCSGGAHQTPLVLRARYVLSSAFSSSSYVLRSTRRWRRRPSQDGRGVVAVASRCCCRFGPWQALVLSVGDPYVGVMTTLPHSTSIPPVPQFGTLLGRYFRRTRTRASSSGPCTNNDMGHVARPPQWGRNIKDGDGPIPILP